MTLPDPPQEWRVSLGPQGMDLAYRVGGEAFLLLLHLIVRSGEASGEAVVIGGYRDLGRRLGWSKDTVGRRIASLVGQGVLERIEVLADTPFHAHRYRVSVNDIRIEVVADPLPRAS